MAYMIRRQYDLAFVFRHTGSRNPNATLYNQHHSRPVLQLIHLDPYLNSEEEIEHGEIVLLIIHNQGIAVVHLDHQCMCSWLLKA